MSSPDLPARSRVVRWALRAFVVVLVLWMGAVAIELWLAKRSTDAALDDLTDIREVATSDVSGFVDALASEEDTVAEETARQRLDDAAGEFRAARRTSRSIFVSPFRALPVIGRQIRSFDALAHAAATAAEQGGTAVDRTSRLLEVTIDTPDERLTATAGTGEALGHLRDELTGLDLGPSEGLVRPLARARNRFADEYERALQTLDRTVVAADGLTEFLTGPSDYLLLAANNAEMQSGSAMYLQAGILHVEDGRMEVGDLRPTSELFIETPSVPIDPDIAARWGSLLPNQEWRNLNLSPRFEQSARMAADMWVADGGAPVDGVLAVDIAALEALLEVTGPIDVGDTTLDAANVAGDLMLDQYVDFQDDRDERRDRLGQVARATFDALDERQWSPSKLLRTLQSTGEGRHLLAWSPHAVEQEAWEAIGIGGEIGPRSMLLSVMNRGGNKLDPFLDVYAELEIEPDLDTDGARESGRAVHRVTVEVTLVNSAPGDLPRYVAGPHPQSGVDAGTYRGFVSLTIPGAGGHQRIEGGQIATVGDDGDARVLATGVEVARDEELTITFSFELPAEQKDLVIEPSARIPATEWFYADDRWSDSEPVAVRW